MLDESTGVVVDWKAVSTSTPALLWIIDLSRQTYDTVRGAGRQEPLLIPLFLRVRVSPLYCDILDGQQSLGLPLVS